MKTQIRSSIFLPVLLVLLVLPLAVWLVFGAVSERFMERVSRQEINSLLESVQSIIERSFVSHSETHSMELEHTQSKTFVSKVKQMLRQTQNDAQLMILTPKLESIYPKSLDSQTGARALYAYVTASINAKSLENDSYQRILLDDRSYLIRIQQMAPEMDARAKYLIAYNPLYDTTDLWHSMGQLAFVITAVLAGLSLIVVWRTADRIAKPMKRLCNYAARIGSGNFQPFEEQTKLCEVDALTRAMGEMAERLEQADKMQKTFLQNASHGLRTPLMSILGYAQGLQCGVFSDSTEPIDAILSESKRLIGLVNELLCLSRMDCEKEILELRTLNLIEVISGCLEQLGGFALDQGVTLVFLAEDTELFALADEKLFAQTFSNIASNAIRFAKSEVTIDIRQTIEQIIITTEDDGNGIAPEDQNHLFERFYRGRNGNYGLGLSIAKTSIEYMGGEIKAFNGKVGAIFEIWLKNSSI